MDDWLLPWQQLHQEVTVLQNGQLNSQWLLSLQGFKNYLHTTSS